MKVVIDIPDEVYIAIKDFDGNHDVLIDREIIYDSIKNGTPPTKKGEWIQCGYQNYGCSECGYVIADSDVEEYNFCPNCRANMKDELIEKLRWNPVSERLPENNDDVLVYDGSDIFVAWYSGINGNWCSADNRFDEYTPIIAWQPLPEPYKAESEE